MNIEISAEARRGCGYRKGGGLYLMGGKPSAPCGRLPIPLSVCPTCGQGIKPTRGWTWIKPGPLVAAEQDGLLVSPCSYVGPQEPAEPTVKDHRINIHAQCPLADENLPERAGLIWIGEKFYPLPSDFMEEARSVGISRRISGVPRDFTVGEDWVMLAHRKCISLGPPCVDDWDEERCAEYCKKQKIGEPDSPTSVGDWKDHIEANAIEWQAGLFTMFKPTHIEYVVKGDKTDDELQKLIDRGIKPIMVQQEAASGNGQGE